ncbi:MAG: MFS transporter [Burkholderiaceae bacterium]|nr:MAG: MFS transporter [Burkholderiaceae bacterium]
MNSTSLTTRHIAQFFFFYFAYVGLVSPFFSLYLQDQGFAAWQIGVLISLVQVLRIFGPNLWGWWADHTGTPVRIMRWLAVGALLGFAFLLLRPGFVVLFIIMVVGNLFVSGLVPLSEVLAAQFLKGDYALYGRLRMWGSIGFIVAVTVAGEVLGWTHIRHVPWLMLGLLALVLVCTYRLPAVTLLRHDDRVTVRPRVRDLLRQPDVLFFLLSVFFMIAAHMALYTYFSIHLAALGYDKQAIGLIWALGVLAEIVVFYFQTLLFRRFTAFAMLVMSFVLCALRFLLIGWLADIWWVLLCAQLLHAFTFGVHHSATLAYMQQWFAHGAQARGQALYSSVGYGLGGSVGGLLCAALWGRMGAQGVFTLSSGLALAALISMICSRRLRAGK